MIQGSLFRCNARGCFGLSGVLLIAMLFTACGDAQKNESSKPVTLQTARLVSHVTSGQIQARDPVRVRFVSPRVDDDRIGQVLKTVVFSFEPEIEGLARWADKRTLEFIPDEPLALNAAYTGTLDLAALFPNLENLEPLHFSFKVAGLNVISFEPEFIPRSPAEPNRLILTGSLVFNQPVPLSELTKALQFRVDEQKVRLGIAEKEAGTTFTFRSEPFGRRKKPRTLHLTLAAEPLGLTADVQKQITLPARKQMSVQKIAIRSEGKTPGLRLTFSDEPDPRQDLSGLITLDPAVAFKVTRSGNDVLLSGEFKHGAGYTITVHPGIRSRWGTVQQNSIRKTITFADRKPRLRFSDDGVILPTANNRKIRFQTLNLSRVQVEIKRVFESNIGQFLQTERLDSRRTRTQSFNNTYVNRVGVVVAQDTLEIGDSRNAWLQHELDLEPLLQDDERGLYLIKLSFTREDMLYGSGMQTERRYYYGPDYYDNPLSPGYLYAHGAVYKPLLQSDIGLTLKKAGATYTIFATRIDEAMPLSGVRISLRSRQNQELASGSTNAEGALQLAGIKEEVMYALAEYRGQYSLLKLDEMAWNNSTFETGGVRLSRETLNAFIYTERGVYRPGDEINLSVIVRNSEGTFPEQHPVSLRLYNPRNQLIFESIQRNARDGFYSFAFATGEEAPTGAWRAEINAGSRTFQHMIRVETVAPQRLKISIEAEKTELHKNDREMHFTLTGNWLFGNPAAGLRAKAEVTLAKARFQPEAWPEFSFEDEIIDFSPYTLSVFDGTLDQAGKAKVRWKVPEITAAPAALTARIKATVLEKGGRPASFTLPVSVHPYEYYVGIRKPELRHGYARIGSELSLQAVVVNPSGDAVTGRDMTLRIFHGRSYWWWEYDSFEDFRLKFRTDTETELVEEKKLRSSTIPVSLTFTPEKRGQYLIEIQENGDNGHRAAFFLQAWAWGAAPASMKDAGNLTLRADREQYAPGETATITFLAPEKATVLFSLEQGSEILERKVLEAAPEQGEMQVRVPITASMLPNVYAAVSIIQPHEQTANDRPLRMYGILPLMVVDSTTRREISLTLPDELESGEPFSVEIQTKDKKPAQLTIAVVDEGLLALTGFQTPDPWQHFFRKTRLDVQTYDVFSHVLGANKGDVFRTFSIGGDYMARLAADLDLNDITPEEARKAKRFKPVSLFQGPMMTDEQGYLKVDFTMPDYIGAVRVMAVAAMHNRFGHADQTVPVTKDLMLVPSLPRVLGPGDSISVPVTVFTMRDNIGKVEVSVELEGPIELKSAARHSLRFDRRSEKDLTFSFQAHEAIGAAKITFIARSSGRTYLHSTDIEVRASSPRLIESTDYELKPGGRLTLTLPDKGYPGSNHALLTLSRRPPMNLDRRINWLLRYPYGCIEQTVSAVFPQLTLRQFISEEAPAAWQREEIDRNINAGIARMRSFQLLNGAFSYWPGTTEPSDWGTNYAGHFLLEAKARGYHVTESMLQSWLRYQKEQARSTRLPLLSRVYKVYLLALAGEPSYSAMNLLKENTLRDMSDREKWLLASAYKLAGVDRTAEEIARTAGTQVREYREFSGTYGSTLRDQAIILESMLLNEHMTEAHALAKSIARVLSSKAWLSTQATGYALLAMGKYLQKVEGSSTGEARLSGSIELPSGESIAFDTRALNWTYAFEEGFGKKVVLHLDQNSSVNIAFATLTWEGVPLHGSTSDEAENLALRVRWLNEDGAALRPENLRQGQVFWAHYRVSSTSRMNLPIEELALEQVLPAGWEIENIRLSGENLPGWMSKWRLNQEEYLDIRDDRIRWFFDLPVRRGKDDGLDFVVKLRAVTAGRYTLPPAQVEAMYNPDYRARKAGGSVVIFTGK